MSRNYSAEKVGSAPYRIQGVSAYGKGVDFEGNVAYRTFDEAVHSATVQSCNAHHVKNGNKFIVYKAIAVVGPVIPAVETTMLDEYYNED